MDRSSIPNVLSAFRIAAAVVLYPLLLIGFKTAFLVLFLLAGGSDLIDGYLARKWKATSALGARLDSIADYLFFGSIPIWIMLSLPSGVVSLYLLPFSILAVISLIYILVRVNVPSTFFHLQSAKFATAAIFITGVLLLFGYVRPWPVWIMTCMIVVAELEELAVIAGINRPPVRTR